MLQDIKKELRESKTLFQFGFLKALGLVTPLVIAKFFSEDMFGTYTLAKLVVFCFSAMLITPSQTPFVVFASRERAETGKVNRSFSIQCVFFVFGVVIYAVAALIFNRQLRNFIGVSTLDVIYVSAGFLGVSLNFLFCNLFLALGQRVKSSLAEFAYGATNLGLVIVLCFLDKLNLRTIFGVYFISAVLVLVIFAKTVDFSVLLPFRFDFGRFREMFSFTRWVFIGATATSLIDWGDSIILKIFNVSIADIGQYGLAYQIFNGIVTLIYFLNSNFLPFISENIKDKNKIRDYLFRKRPRILLFGIILLVGGYIACPLFFKVVYPGSYRESVVILRILLVGCALVLYNTFYIPLLNALQLYRFSQMTNVVIMALKVVLNTLLVMAYGLYGAAVGTVVSYLCMTVIYECHYRIRIKSMLGMKR